MLKADRTHPSRLSHGPEKIDHRSAPQIRATDPTVGAFHNLCIAYHVVSQRQKEISSQITSKFRDTANIASSLQRYSCSLSVSIHQHWSDDMYTTSQMHIGQIIMTSLCLLNTLSCCGPFLLHIDSFAESFTSSGYPHHGVSLLWVCKKWPYRLAHWHRQASTKGESCSSTEQVLCNIQHNTENTRQYTQQGRLKLYTHCKYGRNTIRALDF